MKSNWKNYTLEQVCKRIYSGGTPSTAHPEYWGGDINWLSSGETGQKYIKETIKKITALGVEKSSTKLAQRGCTVVASAGQGFTRGQASFLLIDTYVNQSVIVFDADDKYILPRYLYYNLDNRYEEFRLLSDGTSTRGGLSGWIVKRMGIELPPIEEQAKIVSLLQSIDEKIELNTAINNNLAEKIMNRCPWCLINELETKYHDDEWGVPVYDDVKQFEYLMLEAMQCGLSWDTVLKKREIFRSCFDGFNYEKIATYTAKDIERIMNTAGVIRSQRKIEAVINNARIFQKIRNEFGSFSQYIWSWSGGKALLYRGHELGNLPASNELSDKISADLKKRGMKFLGSVTVYAHLQASGIINDHIKDCYCYKRLLEQYPTLYIES